LGQRFLGLKDLGLLAEFSRPKDLGFRAEVGVALNPKICIWNQDCGLNVEVYFGAQRHRCFVVYYVSMSIYLCRIRIYVCVYVYAEDMAEYAYVYM
jgi:hypothetical protein